MLKLKLLVKSAAFLFLLIAALLVSSAFNLQESERSIAPFDVCAKFTASGWMGDGELGEKHINLFEVWEDNSRPDSICIKIVYKPGLKGWAGIYWQNKPDNWGELAGEDFSNIGYTKLTFFAKGETGRELVEFKAGGIRAAGKKYKDSFEVSTGKVILKRGWKKYTIDLAGKDLSSVIGGFCWVASKSGNPKGLIFYLDSIQYE